MNRSWWQVEDLLRFIRREGLKWRNASFLFQRTPSPNRPKKAKPYNPFTLLAGSFAFVAMRNPLNMAFKSCAIEARISKACDSIHNDWYTNCTQAANAYEFQFAGCKDDGMEAPPIRVPYARGEWDDKRIQKLNLTKAHQRVHEHPHALNLLKLIARIVETLIWAIDLRRLSAWGRSCDLWCSFARLNFEFFCHLIVSRHMEPG